MRDRLEAAAVAVAGVPLDGLAPAGSSVLPLWAQARMIGAYQWLERRSFEVLGAWVGNEPVPEAAVLYDVYSHQHAWHAELLGERLPVVDSIDVEALAVPSSVEVDRLFAVLAGVVRLDDAQQALSGDGPGPGPGAGATSGGGMLRAGGTLLRLVGMGRVVLPRLTAGYGLHLRRLVPVAEAPLARCLRLILRDELDQWQAFETLTQALLRRPHDIAVVTGYQQRLEQMVSESGVGLVSWPDPAPTGGDHEAAPPATAHEAGPTDAQPAPSAPGTALTLPPPPTGPAPPTPPAGSPPAAGRTAVPPPLVSRIGAPPPPPPPASSGPAGSPPGGSRPL